MAIPTQIPRLVYGPSTAIKTDFAKITPNPAYFRAQGFFMA
jgi:hypothetical protein